MADYKNKEKEFQEAFDNAYDQWYQWIAEAHKDFKYTIDGPWTEKDKQKFRDENREVLNFNITRRIVKMITGYERRNRLALKISPSEKSDEKVAGQLNGLISPLMENNHGYEVFSDAFEMGALITGGNLIEPYLDRKGDIQFSRKPYNKFLLDPGFTKRDLSDCGYIIIHEEGMLTRDVKSLLPGKDSLIEQYAKDTQSQITLPYSAYQGKGRDDGERCNYSTFWERTTRKTKIIANRSTGRTTMWKGTTEEFEQLMSRYGMALTSWDDYIDTIKFSAFVNGKCVYKGDDPNGIDDYSFVFVGGFWYPEYDDTSKKLQGIVRPTRDPQREVSKRISKILDIIDSQVSTGVMAEEGALVDPSDIHASGQGKGVWVKTGMMDRVKRIDSGSIDSGLFQLNRDLQTFVNDIAGVNDSLFGSDELKGDVSGYLIKLRQGQALTALQDLFDNLRFSKQQLGIKIIKLLQANYKPYKVMRILNEQPVPQLFTEDLAKYDVTPQEGLLTETQMQTFYNELLMLKQMGAPITWQILIEFMPTQFPDKLRQAIAQEEQRQQAGQAEELKEKQLLDQMRMAKISADLGRGDERRSQQVENKANAALLRVKTMQEIKKFDWDKEMELLDRVIAMENVSQKKSVTKR
jgi:hypothetical protein